MTKEDIDAFIRIMKEVQINYTPEEVEEAYGDLTLKEAVAKRLSKINTFYQFVAENIKPDAE